MVQPLPDFIKSREQLLIGAKRVYLRNETNNEGVRRTAKAHKQMGRWQIVDKSEQADLVLVFSANSRWTLTGGGGGGFGMKSPQNLTAIHPVTGVPLVSVSTEKYITAGWTARRLVDRMRKEVEGVAARPMPPPTTPPTP
jgi:hypothetical protein